MRLKAGEIVINIGRCIFISLLFNFSFDIRCEDIYDLDRSYFALGDSTTPIKAEFSFSKKFYDKLPLSFGYHHKTIWDVNKGSSPVVDSNYNPHLFYQFENVDKWQLTLGILEHLSNGQVDDKSRGLNMSYFHFGRVLNYSHLRVIFGFKIYISYKKDNGSEDIVNYNGIWKSRLTLLNPFNFLTLITHSLEFRFAPGGQWGTKVQNGNIEASLNFEPFSESNVKAFIQFFRGRNEYLLDYKVYHNALRIGMLFKI
jgi:outer membrane phospholipase A